VPGDESAQLPVGALQIIHQLLAMHERQPEADELAQAIVALQSVTTDLAMLSIFPADDFCRLMVMPDRRTLWITSKQEQRRFEHRMCRGRFKALVHWGSPVR